MLLSAIALDLVEYKIRFLTLSDSEIFVFAKCTQMHVCIQAAMSLPPFYSPYHKLMLASNMSATSGWLILYHTIALQICENQKHLKVTQMTKFCLLSDRNIVGRGENAVCQHFLPFPQHFQRLSLKESSKFGISPKVSLPMTNFLTWPN